MWREWPQRVLMALVQGYRLLLSPWLGNGCRFEPTCSAYALEALQRHGAATGSRLTLQRLARCHPWCEGGHDPVPAERPAGLFTRLIPRHLAKKNAS
jgi:putative membrane protein insertion efficiency factor